MTEEKQDLNEIYLNVLKQIPSYVAQINNMTSETLEWTFSITRISIIEWKLLMGEGTSVERELTVQEPSDLIPTLLDHINGILCLDTGEDEKEFWLAVKSQIPDMRRFRKGNIQENDERKS